MALCRDKSLTFLNDKGYNVVRVPRGGIGPLDLLGRDDGAMEWLGRLDALWQSPQPLPRVLPPEPAVDIEGKRTDSLGLEAGLSLLKGILSAFHAGAGLEAAYSQASALEFGYTNVRSLKVAPLEIGAFLARGATDRDNPVIRRYFLDNKAQGFALTEVLTSDQLKVTARADRGESLKVDVEQISATLGANAGVKVSRTAENALVYAGGTPVTFAFRLLRIAFADGRWEARGAKAGGDLSFATPGEEAELAALTENQLLEVAGEPPRG
jgi:hypothetical protein